MIELTREMIAYSLIVLIFLLGVPVIAITVKRRRREKLRRKGIKRYGH